MNIWLYPTLFDIDIVFMHEHVSVCCPTPTVGFILKLSFKHLLVETRTTPEENSADGTLG